MRYAVKESLYLFNSYDPIRTIVDSAFAPMDNPAFFEKTLKLYELGVEMEDCDHEMKLAKSSMMIWSGSWDAYIQRMNTIRVKRSMKIM